MDIIPIAIWSVLILVGVSLALMVLFGLRSLSYGKVNPISIVLVVFPLLLFFGLGLVLGDWPTAGVYSVVIMLTLGMLALLFSSIRGLIGM
jgi:hypothetical protein